MNGSIFSQEQLSKIIKETLPADAPVGTSAVIGSVDQDGAQVVVSMQLKKHWEIQGAARHDWDTGANSLGGKVAVRW